MKIPRPIRRTCLLVALAVLLVPTSARAATASFAYTGGEQPWTVLPGVFSVEVTATGAAGATAAGAGGFGAVARATIAVVPGQTLYVNVGGPGTVPTSGFGGDGFNGGGLGYAPGAAGDASGGGGGASDVRSCSRTVCSTGPLTDSRLVIAAGGGGGGGQAGAPGAGGVGAQGGVSGGGSGGNGTNATGGSGGSAGAGGNGGLSASGNGGGGGRFQGGVAGFSIGEGSGGGGGGGYFGGGGGAAGASGSGAGGGAGSSFAHLLAANVSFATAGVTAGSVTLTYTQLLPEIASVLGASVAFPGIQPRGEASAAQTLTLRNDGLAALVVGAVELAGPAAAEFALVGNTCTAAVAPSATCTLSVAFTPNAAGTRAATLRVSSNDLTDPTIEIALSGEGGVPHLVLEPPAGLAFGPQEVATIGAPKDLVVRNTGNAPLVIASIDVIGSTDFVPATSTCATAVAPGATCTASLRFAPRSAGIRQGTIRIRSNDPVAAATDAPLSGSGATKAELRAPVVTALALAPKTFQAANLGGSIAPASRVLAAGQATRVGGQVTFRLSSAATVRFTVERVLPGVRRGTRCVAPPRTGSAGQSCTRYGPVRGAFAYTAKTGRNGFLFSGRLGGRSLAAGSYRLLAQATDGAKRRSSVARASFRIVRPAG